MRTVRFTYLLMDNLGRAECLEEIAQLAGIEMTDALDSKIGDHPFGYVALQCELDTETGAIRILGASA